jgi:hypothetical protein
MAGILSIVKGLNIECLSSEAFNLDYERFAEYRDAEEHPAQEPFETPPLTDGRRRLSPVPPDIPPILTYFLDGSRRTYKVADIIIDGRYFYPLVAGQIGVAVVSRDIKGQIKPHRGLCRIRNVLAFPDKVSLDDLADIQQSLRADGRLPVEVLRYEIKQDRDYTDLAVAKIMSEMHAEEVRVVQQMVAENLLWNEAMLVVDGPLRFKKHFEVAQFRNVIGVSKTFRPTFTVGRGRRKESVGTVVSALGFGERTNVFKMVDDQRVLGMWYLRIRPPQQMSNPLQGVIKVERYAVEQAERDDGLDGVRVDVISQHLLRERNVTPFKADPRWAGHLYPVYLAESFLKTSFRSDGHFMALFQA